jgi:hypothetical protein
MTAAEVQRRNMMVQAEEPEGLTCGWCGHEHAWTQHGEVHVVECSCGCNPHPFRELQEGEEPCEWCGGSGTRDRHSIIKDVEVDWEEDCRECE